MIHATYPYLKFAKHASFSVIGYSLIYFFFGLATVAKVMFFFYWCVFVLMGVAYLLVKLSQSRSANRPVFELFVAALREKGVLTKLQISISMVFLACIVSVLMHFGYIATTVMVLLMQTYKISAHLRARAID